MTDGKWIYIFVSAVVGIGCAIIIAYFKEHNKKAPSTNTFEMNSDKWEYIKTTYTNFDAKLNSIENSLRSLTQDFSVVVDRRYHDEPVTTNRRK